MRILFAILFIANVNAFAVPQLVNYQGSLASTSGTPLDTTVAMTFRIFNVSSGGAALWTETSPAVSVQNGLFNVSLGAVAPLADEILVYSSTWLGITVGNNTEMTPRTRLSSVPYAYRVGTIDASTGGEIDGTVLIYNGSLGVGLGNDADYLFNLVVGTANEVYGTHSSVTGGNSQRTDSAYSFIGGGQSNRTTGRFAGIASGTANVASTSAFVGGGSNNAASGDHATVGGGRHNGARGQYSFVGGGGGAIPFDSNSAIGAHAVIGGGKRNSASGDYSIVSGGSGNSASVEYATISGGSNNDASNNYATVSGGFLNYATGNTATISGGGTNAASGSFATVSGGGKNTASGSSSTVAGGYGNTAAGSYAFAAGHNAHAGANGVFAWADDNIATFAPGVTNTFNVRASGGVRLYTNAAASIGAILGANQTAWAVICDSTKKTRYGKVDTKTVLERLSAIPIETWSYKEDPNHIKHMGPMAQAFWNAFQLGESDTTISTLDPDGVALAAIQELAKRTQRIEQLESEVAELKTLVNQLIQLGHK